MVKGVLGYGCVDVVLATVYRIIFDGVVRGGVVERVTFLPIQDKNNKH